MPVNSEPSEEQLLAAAIASRSDTSGAGVSGGTLEITLGKDGKTKKEKRLVIVTLFVFRLMLGKSLIWISCPLCREKDLFQKEFESLQKHLCQDIHKFHLLCLLALGLRKSQLCNDPNLQGLLLSLLSDTKELLCGSSTLNTSDSVLKLLRWFMRERNLVEIMIQQSITEGGVFSMTQSFVALLRAMGLRTRLVMVLDPRPYKTTPTKLKASVSCADASQTKRVRRHPKQAHYPTTESVSTDHMENVEKKSRILKVMEEKVENKQSNTRDKSQGSRSRKGLRKSSTRTPEAVSSSTTECSTSPYFKTKLKTENSLISDTEFLMPRESVTKCPSSQEDNKRNKRKRLASSSMSHGDDDDFVPPKPAGKRKSKTRRSTKKLRTFEDDLATASNTDTQSPNTSHSHCEGSAEQACSNVELTNVEDRLSWAEVFVAIGKKWIPVHLPSCSVGQPQLCEKDCPLSLDYVLAFENGT